MACNKCSCSNKYDKDLIEIAKKYEGSREEGCQREKGKERKWR